MNADRRDKSSPGNFFSQPERSESLSRRHESNMTKIKSRRTKNKGEQKSTKTSAVPRQRARLCIDFYPELNAADQTPV